MIVGKTSKFAAHITRLGKNFKAVTEGLMIVKLIGNGAQLIDTVGKLSSPGIFRLSLTPKKPGTYQLIFAIQTNKFFDKLKIHDITVYPDTKTALKNQQKQTIGDEIVYLKEQAWKNRFCQYGSKKRAFY